jgi:hypothetical protein
MIFCDTCVNFSVHEMNGGFLCSKKNKMKFRTPRSPIDDEWGFYVRKCDDFCFKELDEESVVQKTCSIQCHRNNNGYCSVSGYCVLRKK